MRCKQEEKSCCCQPYQTLYYTRVVVVGWFYTDMLPCPFWVVCCVVFAFCSRFYPVRPSREWPTLFDRQYSRLKCCDFIRKTERIWFRIEKLIFQFDSLNRQYQKNKKVLHEISIKCVGQLVLIDLIWIPNRNPQQPPNCGAPEHSSFLRKESTIRWISYFSPPSKIYIYTHILVALLSVCWK